MCAGMGGGNDEREQTINQLLTEMDGFEGNTGIIILAATNRPDVLDSALLRPGRFDRQVTVDRPDVQGRVAILKVHSRGKSLAKDIDFDKIARRTPGFTGADLQNLMNEAAIMAARRDLKEISKEEIADALERIVAGPEKACPERPPPCICAPSKNIPPVLPPAVALSVRLSQEWPCLYTTTRKLR